MGWKNIKKHYRIGHTVHVSQGNICVGSAYISEIIVISPDGVLIKGDRNCVNDELARYQREMKADPALLQRLATTPDEAPEKSVPVYTWDGGKILEKFCEEPGWPNVTHDGRLMYDNSFSTDKAKVIEWAKKDVAYGIKAYSERITEKEKEYAEVLAEARANLARCEANKAELDAAYPESQAPAGA